MKKLLLILLIPMIGFGQTQNRIDSIKAEEYFREYLADTNGKKELSNSAKIQLITKVIELNSNHKHAYRYRAQLYEDFGNYKDAIDDWIRYKHINNIHDVNDRIGFAFKNLGNYKEALYYYNLSISHDESSWNYMLRGDLYKEMNKINNAIEDYCSAIRIYPDDDRVYLQRGNLYLDLGKYEEAIADYSRAIKVNSVNSSAYVNRGIAKQNSGLSFCSDYKKACDLGKKRCCQWYNNECR